MSEIRVQDDLYEFVNGDWIRKAKIPSDQSSTGCFYLLRDNVEKIMLREFKRLSKKEDIKDEFLRKAVTIYKKVLDSESRLKGLPYLLKEVSYYDDIKSLEDISSRFYYMYANNMCTPLAIGVGVDMKDATKRCFECSSLSTILPDTTYYGTPKGDELLKAYSKMAKEVLAKLGIENGEEIVKSALEFDNRISKIVKSQEEWSEYVKCYNPWSLDEIDEKLGFISIKSFALQRFGFTPDKIIVLDPRFIENFASLFSDGVSCYVNWAKLSTALSGAPYISEELRDLVNSYSRVLSGVKKSSSVEKFAYRLANSYYSEPIGIYYGRKYFGERAKNECIELVKNLIQSYKERLAANTWLSKETANKAIVKLDKMELKIGYPDKIGKLYYLMNFDPEASLLEIISSLDKISNEFSDSRLSVPVDKKAWVMPGHMVNACYNPSFNDITFPAAILQAPFFSIDQKIEENYGGIGCVIGHEISHAFDNNGAQMDENGNINNWWTEADYSAFNEKTEEMVKQFDGLPIAGGKVNGRLTVSENIADNGGVASSLQSLKRVKENPDLQAFFLNHARVWCVKAREKYMQLLLNIDVHSPAYYRANMQVRNFDEFYDAFDVKEGDKMFMPKDKRLIIW